MNPITPAQFFGAIFPEPLGPGQLMVCSKIRRSGKTATDWCYGLHQAARQVEGYRRTREVLFGVALQDRKQALARARRRLKRAAPSSVRGGEESVVALPALWAEIQVAADSDPAAVHPGQAHTLALLEALPMPPSILVWTGTAFQIYWRLDKPWVLEEDEERRRARRLLDKLRWALAHAAAAAGWPRAVAMGEARADLAGLMRVAGTFHHRGRRRWPIVVERLPRVASDRRWAPEDFEKLDDPPPRAEPRPWEEPRRSAAPAGDEENAADFEAVWRGCAWLRHCHRHQATLPEAEWNAALSIVGRGRTGAGTPEVGSPEVGSPEGGSPEVGPPEGGTPAGAGGRHLAHSFSRRHPGYAPETTDEALKRALRRRPATCRRIGGGLGAGDRYCSHCPHQGRIESPIVLGARDRDGEPGEPAAATAPETTGRTSTAPPASPPPAAPEAEARDDEELPFGPIDGGQPQIELLLRISPSWPATSCPRSWAPVVRAAIASLEQSLQSSPPAPQGALEAAARGAGGVPRSAVTGSVPPILVDGLEELLAALGGRATARQMVEVLAAPRNRDRFGLLRTALWDLVPGLVGGVPTARQLGRTLASCRGRTAGGRTIVRTGRLRTGIAWAVRKPEKRRRNDRQRGEKR